MGSNRSLLTIFISVFKEAYYTLALQWQSLRKIKQSIGVFENIFDGRLQRSMQLNTFTMYTNNELF